MTEGEEGGVGLTLNIFIQLAIAVLVFLALFAYVQSIYTDDSFEKNYIAKDLALAIEAIQTPQGNTVLTYAKDTDKYDIIFEESRVEVFKKSEGKEVASFLKGIAGFSIDAGFEFEDTKLNYSGTELRPILVKTNNMLMVKLPGEEYNEKLYYIKKINTSKEPKDYKFGAESQDSEFIGYVKTLPDILNSAAGTKFSYSDVNPDFVILESSDENMIYVPADKAKRNLANIMANNFIEQKNEILILPSGNDQFVIKINKELTSKLTTVLKDSFREYYKNG